MDTLRIPLGPDLAATFAKAEKALRSAMQEYANENGLFLEEVVSNYQGVKRWEGMPCLTYTLDRIKRK